MLQLIEELCISTTKDKFINITDQILDILAKFKLKNGLLNLTILHTSASLMVQENADPTVLKDIHNTFLDKIVPQKLFSQYRGSDDMPAHIKSLLTNTSLTLTVSDGQLVLGTWQGIFLMEHKRVGKIRKFSFSLFRRVEYGFNKHTNLQF